jgi:hypothetical protein
LLPGGVVEGCLLSNEGRKPGPVLGASTSRAGLGANAGEGLSLGLSPTGRRPPRKGSIGICGARSSERMARATDPRGGEGTPRRDPGGPAGRSRPQGRVVATKAPQPRCGPAYRTSHGAARPHRASHGTPGRTGGHGRLRVKGGKERETLGLHDWMRASANLWAGCVGVALNLDR